jgi:monofunctional glycosyltransferase
MNPEKRRFWPSFWRIVRNSIILFFVISIGWVVVARFVPVLITPLMLIRSVEAVFEGKAPKISKQWVPMSEISPNMVKAVVASEDNLFMKHHGFSFKSMRKAWEHNKKGKRIRGGSTISQQTAKNVFLWPQRSYLRKGLEAYFTVLIELLWSKERIMEVYLNVIEMGPGIYGVQAAAKEHFGKDALKLSKGQAALIAGCLPNPRRFIAGNPSPYIQRRKGQIMSLMNKIGRIEFIQPENNKKKKSGK